MVFRDLTSSPEPPPPPPSLRAKVAHDFSPPPSLPTTSRHHATIIFNSFPFLVVPTVGWGTVRASSRESDDRWGGVGREKWGEPGQAGSGEEESAPQVGWAMGKNCQRRLLQGVEDCRGLNP